MLILPFATACSSSDTTPNGAGALRGTLYFDEGADYTMHKVDLATGAHTLLGKGKDGQITPQGTLLCIVDSNLAEAPITLETYRHIHDETIGSDIFADGFKYPRLSPDGSKVAYLTNDGRIGVVDRQSGALITAITDPNLILGYDRPSWTPDGRLVFASELGDAGIFITDAALANPTRFDPQLTDVTEAIVSHDGKFVAFIKTKQVWRMGIDGSNPAKVDGENNDPNDDLPFWSPDDTVIFWHNGYSDVGFRPADGSGTTLSFAALFPATADEILGIPQGAAMDWVK